MKDRRLRALCALLFLFCFGLLLRFPSAASAAVSEGLSLCVHTMIPAMFPYFVLTNLAAASRLAERPGPVAEAALQRCFHVRCAGASAVLLGFLGGYPLGAKTAAALCRERRISREEARTLLCFCNNAGPSFLFGVIGGKLYRSAAVGGSLFVLHAVSSLLTGLLLRGRQAPPSAAPQTEPPPSLPSVLVSSVRDAGQTLFQVCTFIVFFFVLTAPLRASGSASLLSCVLCGLTELSGGCALTAASALPWTVKYALTAVFLGWGGLCIHLQTACVLEGCGLPFGRYLGAKALHAVLSGLLAIPVSRLLRPAAAVGAFPTVPPVGMLPLLPILAWLFFFATGNPRRNGV